MLVVWLLVLNLPITLVCTLNSNYQLVIRVRQLHLLARHLLRWRRRAAAKLLRLHRRRRIVVGIKLKDQFSRTYLMRGWWRCCRGNPKGPPFHWTEATEEFFVLAVGAPSPCAAVPLQLEAPLRLCSFHPTPAGIGSKSTWVSRDQILMGLIPPLSYDVFGYALPGFHPTLFHPDPVHFPGKINIYPRPVERIPESYVTLLSPASFLSRD